MMKKNIILEQARFFGGDHLYGVSKDIIDSGEKIPMQVSMARRFWGVGKKTLMDLQNIGIVNQAFSGLSTRAVNCLEENGISGPEEARMAIISGRLTPRKKRWSGGVRKYGRKTHKEVCKWAGLPDPQKLLHVK